MSFVFPTVIVVLVMMFNSASAVVPVITGQELSLVPMVARAQAIVSALVIAAQVNTIVMATIVSSV